MLTTIRGKNTGYFNSQFKQISEYINKFDH